ncbi:UNVERIFIED_ORG: hypothetical protein ABIB52_000711 [Arthrobacter sp. UYCu721]
MSVPLTNQLTISTYANGFGRWCADVSFNPPLSESDDRPEHNLVGQWPAVCMAAREAIIDQLVPREQKTTETEAQVRARLTEALPNLQLLTKNNDGLNLTHSVTLGE